MFTAPQSQHRKPRPLSRGEDRGAAAAAGTPSPPLPSPPLPAPASLRPVTAPPPLAAGEARGRLGRRGRRLKRPLLGRGVSAVRERRVVALRRGLKY